LKHPLRKKLPESTDEKKGFVIILTVVNLLLLAGSAAQADDTKLLRKFGLVTQSGFISAPDFTTQTLEGQEKGLDDFRGRLVLLNFWATWCPPCRLEMPSLEKLYREFGGQGLEVVAMNFMEGPEVVTRFIKENGLTFPVLLDSNGEIAQRYNVRGLPVTVLIGRQGNLLAKSIGYKDWFKKDLRQFVGLLLNDESVIDQGKGVEVTSGPSQADRQRQVFTFGIAFLALLFAFYLWVKRGRFREKQKSNIP
jgi:thiol-disulfide isomerase/thioredoxin